MDIKRMKIGILVAGDLSQERKLRFGTLATMFETLLSSVEPELIYQDYDVFKDVFPTDPQECDGWLITGSYHSAYEDLPWMLRLQAFIRETLDANIPMIGICFGHQIMAQALGGRVEREASGKWGAAVNTYKLDGGAGEFPSWMSSDSTQISLQASHQDQVTILPTNAKLLGGNDFCPNGILSYGNTGFSMQLHPELSSDFIRDVFETRRGDVMSEEETDLVLEKVDLPVDSPLAARWMVDFFKLNQP